MRGTSQKPVNKKIKPLIFAHVCTVPSQSSIQDLLWHCALCPSLCLAGNQKEKKKKKIMTNRSADWHDWHASLISWKKICMCWTWGPWATYRNTYITVMLMWAFHSLTTWVQRYLSCRLVFYLNIFRLTIPLDHVFEHTAAVWQAEKRVVQQQQTNKM